MAEQRDSLRYLNADNSLQDWKIKGELKKKNPGRRVMLIAEKGTMGVGSSRMSGVNNVALWIGRSASPYIPFVNIAPIVGGTNGISPIFLTTVGVTGYCSISLYRLAGFLFYLQAKALVKFNPFNRSMELNFG